MRRTTQSDGLVICRGSVDDSECRNNPGACKRDTDRICSSQAKPPPPCVTQALPVELHRFSVDGKAHGTGLASSLMQEVHQVAHDFKASHVWLGVWERNPRAIAFYKKEKFVEVGSQFYMVGPDRQLDRVLVASVGPEGPGSP